MSYICAPGTVLPSHPQLQSLVVAPMRKQYFNSPRTPVKSIIPCTVRTLELKLSFTRSFMICFNASSSTSVPALGVARVLCRDENRSPRYCVEYRHTHNRHIICKSWHLPNPDSCLDAARGVMFISTADIHGAVWQLPHRRVRRPDSIRHFDWQVPFHRYAFWSLQCPLVLSMHDVCYGWPPWS